MRTELCRYLESPEGCWIWQGALNPKGYATLGGTWARKTGRSILAHRVSWEDANDARIPDGHTIDHLCRTRSCIRPDHLEAVPHFVNVRRGLKTKLNESQVKSILRHAAEGKSTTAIARAHGISVGNTQMIIHGKIWQQVESRHRDAIRLAARNAWNVGPVDEALEPYAE